MQKDGERFGGIDVSCLSLGGIYIGVQGSTWSTSQGRTESYAIYISQYNQYTQQPRIGMYGGLKWKMLVSGYGSTRRIPLGTLRDQKIDDDLDASNTKHKH